jgi:hypothetical protein
MPRADNASFSTIASSELLNLDPWDIPQSRPSKSHFNQAPAITGFDFQVEQAQAPASDNRYTPLTMEGVDKRKSAFGGEQLERKKSKDESRRKTKQFEDQFAYKESWDTHSADDIRRHSPVLLELRTNVIVSFKHIS